MISFIQIDPAVDCEALVDFMTGNEWPFHVMSAPSAAAVRKAVERGVYCGSENESYWIEHAELGRIGFFRLEDLEDETPMFDLRLAEKFRGRGLAAQILEYATKWVFGKLPKVRRFEGQTRDDNIAMRKAFVRAGWVKEAYYRQCWPVEGQQARASVAYAVLRSDFENGTITPVPWDEEY